MTREARSKVQAEIEDRTTERKKEEKKEKNHLYMGENDSKQAQECHMNQEYFSKIEIQPFKVMFSGERVS